MILLILCLFSVSIIWYFDLLKRFFVFQRIIKFSKTTVGPKIIDFIRNSKREKVVPFLLDCYRQFGDRFGIWFGKDYIVFFSDPEDLKTILTSQEIIYKSKNYQLLKPWLGEGLLIAGGEKWQKARKLLTPAFHFNILKQFQGAMGECGELLVNKLEREAAGKGDVDIYPYITLFALDVICETALGVKMNAQVNSESEYVKAVKGLCKILHYRSFSFFLRNDFTFQFSKLNQMQDKLLKILHGETNRIIASRKAQLIASNIKSQELLPTDETNVYLSTKKRFAFLDMLLMQQLQAQNISDLQIRMEVDTFMFEGHDTTSSAISFAVYELSRNPAEQKLAYEETSEFEGREHEPMKYLEAVIKETLRLYPSVPFYGRVINVDEYVMRDMKIPKGVMVGALAYTVHRNPEIYPNPEKFMPSRFLNEDNIHPFAHIAFSAGPRNCIGQKFAMLEMKCILSKLLRAFRFEAAEHKPQLIAEIILKSANGVFVKLEKRD